MSAVYAFVIAVFVYRDLSLREVPGVLLSQLECNAGLYHHQRGVVLLPDDA
jgi:C4-dicarboxylate transporter, DctM subunit